MHDQVEVVARAVDVFAEVSGSVGLLHRSLEPTDDVQHFAAHVDEGVLGANGVAGDDHALDQGVRASHHQRNVFAGARL